MAISAKKTGPFVGWLAVLCLAVLLGGAAQAQTGSITGQVMAADTREPLAGAAVEISGPALAGKKGAIADEKGHYTIENVLAGAYTLRVTHVGYVAGTVRKVNVTQGASATVDFHLETAPYALGETVVSASRRAENIIDAPASISKVGWEEARRNAADNSYSSLLKNVKGVDYTQTGVFTEAFNTRGFNTSFNTRMLMLLDGIPIGVAAAFTPVFPIPRDDVQDVEVIVGPGSALYGPDAVAGIINVTSRDPRASQGTTLAVSGGSRSTFKGRLRHAGTRDKWGWKISGDYQRARDFEVVNTFYSADSTISVTDDPDFDAKSLRGGAGLLYYPDHQSSVGFTMGAGRATFIDMLDSGRGQRDNNTQHYQRLAYTSPRLYLNAYRTNVDGNDDFLLHTRAANRLKGLSEEEARRGASLAFVGKTWGMEARYSITPPFLEHTHFNAGTDLRQTNYESPILKGGKADVGLFGIYGHAEIDLDEKLRLILSTRGDFHELYPTQVSPKAGLIYKPRPTAAFRLTFNRAFKNPGIIQERLDLLVRPGMVARGSGEGFRFGTTTGEPLPPAYADGIPELETEKNTTIELGYKGILANKVFLDVSGYRSRYSNFISPLRLIGNPSAGVFVLDEKGVPRAGEATVTYLNFGEQVVWGLDLGVNVYASERVTLKGNASFIEADDLQAPEGFDQPFNTPATTFNAVFSTSDLLTRGSTVDLSLHRVSEFDFRTAAHVGAVPAYAVFDLNLGYQMPIGITYRLTVKNLFDNDHVEMVDGPEIGRLVVAEIEYAF